LKIRPEEISNLIKTEIQNYKKSLDIKTSGSVVEVGDGIARIYGLSNAKAGELLEFASGVRGMALNLEENNVGAVILGDASSVKEGDEVKATGQVAAVPAGENLLGRVVKHLESSQENQLQNLYKQGLSLLMEWYLLEEDKENLL
jgi:F-type H+-transporting ATPase subunit alpha